MAKVFVGRAQNRVQQRNVRRVLGIVAGGVVVAEHEVLEERAVGVLHAEVALLDHEVDQALVDDSATGCAASDSA